MLSRANASDIVGVVSGSLGAAGALIAICLALQASGMTRRSPITWLVFG